MKEWRKKLTRVYVCIYILFFVGTAAAMRTSPLQPLFSFGTIHYRRLYGRNRNNNFIVSFPCMYMRIQKILKKVKRTAANMCQNIKEAQRRRGRRTGRKSIKRFRAILFIHAFPCRVCMEGLQLKVVNFHIFPCIKQKSFYGRQRAIATYRLKESNATISSKEQKKRNFN